MTKRSAPNRFDPFVEGNGLPSLRFAETIENLVEDVNNVVAAPVNTQSSDYTWVLDDTLIRFTGTVALKTTIPDNDSVGFEIGSVVEVQNDTSKTLNVVIDTDTLIFEADGTTGSRSIAAAGSGRFRKIEATIWKCRGQQMT